LPPGELDHQEFVDDLEGLRSELNLERAYFVGHSLGSFITAAYMVQHPERVWAACLLAAPGGRTEATRQAAKLFIEKLRTEGLENAMAALVGRWYTDEFVAAQPDTLRSRLQQVARIDEDVFIRTYELYNGIDIERWLDDIKAPTLVMTGEFAQGAGAAVARSIADTLTNSKVVIFEGLKNGILTEIPGRIAEELFAFFRQHRADR
jgi:pimeloyl-ACP methyl ester carboxylesterase